MKNANYITLLGAGLLGIASCSDKNNSNEQPPNILWILAEDASPDFSCYGEKTITTPNADKLADEGIKFTNAFVTCPVSSPSRSAMITGMYQTTLGAHNHRSQRYYGKGSGNEKFYPSYSLPEKVKMIPQLFKKAGYYTVLAQPESFKNKDTIWGKTDYNFEYKHENVYDSDNWALRPKGKPFFAQIQLHGGKQRNAEVDNPVNPDKVTLPPYYPNDSVMRQDRAEYLNSILLIDQQVGQIMDTLKTQGLLENTIVFFWTDHGISHLRGKQFLYDEGIKVPLIVRFPEKYKGTVRNDLVTQIDIAATSLSLAGIEIPDYVQGKDVFAPDYQPTEFIVSARDRCDETIDVIRCIRNKHFKYIRNFYAHLPHMQPNRYKSRKQIVKHMRYLYDMDKLNEPQARIYDYQRPPEELYDLKNDPYETHNLAKNPAFNDTLKVMREKLYSWMVQTGDLGLIPEPELEKLGLQEGNKYFVTDYSRKILPDVIRTIENGENDQINELLKAFDSPEPTVRYWAATKSWTYAIDNDLPPDLIPKLKALANDESASVRIAAGRSLCRLHQDQAGLEILKNELDNPNDIAEMYTLWSIEKVRTHSLPLLPVWDTLQTDYEFSNRLLVRMKNYFLE